MNFDFENFKNNPIYYEELTLTMAQEFIAQIMYEQGISKTELAQRLNKNKAAITRLLSDGRNLTLRSFGRILHAMDTKVEFTGDSISASLESREVSHKQPENIWANAFERRKMHQPKMPIIPYVTESPTWFIEKGEQDDQITDDLFETTEFKIAG